MYDIAILVFAAIAAIAAVVAALPPLGFDLRIIGRPKMPLEGIPYFRARQAWIAIGIAVISLAVSMGAFYYFFRPRIVEKIVEKPVEKIVEKVVPKECPQASNTTAAPPKKHGGNSSVLIPPGTTINATTNAPNSAAVGVNTGTVNVNPDPTKAVTTYFLNGEARISKPGSTTGTLGERDSYNQLLNLAAQGDWPQVLTLSDSEIAKAPTWMTPYYYKALCEGNLQHFDEAIELFKYVESNVEGNKDYGNLAEMARHFRAKVEKLKQAHP
jgi:hypothetical protein